MAFNAILTPLQAKPRMASPDPLLSKDLSDALPFLPAHVA